METRGRKRDVEAILKTQELYEAGMGTKEIAEQLGCSQPIVQYRLRQKLKVNEVLDSQRKSLNRCFWEADEETRIKVADLLDYTYVPAQTSKVNNVELYINMVSQQPEKRNEEENNSLLNRVKKLFTGEIKPYEVDDYFTEDEIVELNRCPKYVAYFGKVAWGVNTNITMEQVIDELTEKGIK